MENDASCAHNQPPPTRAHHEELQHHQDDEEFVCEICIETMSLADRKFKNGDKCTHPFCNNCVIEYIRIKLGDDNTGHIKCPAPDCDHMLDPLACATLIGHSLLLRWCDVLCEGAIMGWKKCYCPHTDCNVLIINECGGDLSQSRCPKCKRWFCFRCKTVWHSWITCQENRDAAPFRRLAAQKRWRRCPFCQCYVELTEGCSFVRCRCGIMFCYQCGNRVRQHSLCSCELSTMMDTLGLMFVLFALVACACGLYIYFSSLGAERRMDL